MQRCDHCNSTFSWSKIFKSYWWIYKPIKCDNCDAKHKITFLGRGTITALSLFPIWIFAFFLSPFDNIFVTTGIGVFIGIIGFMLAPYVTQYKEVE